MQTPNIKFGTDGWRGLIADDFTYDNAALVGTAIHHYLNEAGSASGPLLIGYDNRFAAELYAAHLASQISSLGREVRVFDSACPTPAVAFAVQHLGACCAIMLTASHNPYTYQGLKFIPDFAGPAMPEATDRITELIKELAPGFDPPKLQLQWAGPGVNIREQYFAKLDSLLDRDVLLNGSIGGQKLRVFYTAMHGVGGGWLDEYLRRAGVDVVSTALERDVYFGGSLPDPSEANLQRRLTEALAAGCNVVLGTDGDADRFGLLDTAGRYFGANQALPMLAEHLIAHKGRTGTLVRTVATSHLLDGVAKLHGLELVETAVGFKYVGAELRKGALIGGEESGGISLQGHIPEKDGILACLLMLELACGSGKGWQESYEELSAKVGPRAYRRMDEHLSEGQKSRLLSGVRSLAGESFAGQAITGRNMMDGICFSFADGSWMLVRGSGTEPLVRIYVEVSEPEALDSRCAEIRTALLELAGPHD